jgi:hypothetical protein
MNAAHQAYRTSAAGAYRDYMIRTLGWELPRVNSADELIALARRVTPPPFEAENGWRTEPPFPGAGERPEEMLPGGWRMICACRLYAGQEEVGAIFMTFFSGRPVAVVVSPPGTVIPEEYLPIAPR